MRQSRQATRLDHDPWMMLAMQPGGRHDSARLQDSHVSDRLQRDIGELAIAVIVQLPPLTDYGFARR